RREPGNVVALEDDAALGGTEKFGEQIEASRLAGPVGADQRVDLAALDAQVDVADRHEARVFLGEALGLEDGLVGHETRQFPSGPPVVASFPAKVQGRGLM